MWQTIIVVLGLSFHITNATNPIASAESGKISLDKGEGAHLTDSSVNRNQSPVDINLPTASSHGTSIMKTKRRRKLTGEMFDWENDGINWECKFIVF